MIVQKGYNGMFDAIITPSKAGGVVVTRGTPHPGYSPMVPDNLNPICTLVMLKGSLSPRVLPNGTQAISILYVH